MENIYEKDLAPITDKNTDLISKFMTNKAYQFEFNNGLKMANTKLPLKTKISLNYHIENNNSVEAFLDSIVYFIKSSDKDFKLTEFEKEKLIKIYYGEKDSTGN